MQFLLKYANSVTEIAIKDLDRNIEVGYKN